MNLIARRFLLTLLPPLITYVLARLFLFYPGELSGYDTMRPGSWARWDAGHYLSIARNGYELFTCDVIGYSPDEWCGTTAWLPGYPWLIRLVSRLIGIPRQTAAVILSGAFAYLSLLVLWRGFMGAQIDRTNILTLLLASFFAGSIYYHAIFPISMVGFFIILCLYFLREQRWLASGIAGAAAAFTYPSGLLLSPLAALWTLYPSSQSSESKTSAQKRIVGPLVRSAGVAALGFAGVLLVHQWTLHAWNAFFLVQQKYRHDTLQDPLRNFTRAVAPLFEHGPDRLVPAFQTLMVAGLIAAILVAMVVRRRQVTAFDVFLLLTVVLFWSFPFLIGRSSSLYRSEALLFPMVLLTRLFPWPLQAAILGLFIAVHVHMATLFFHSVLV